MSTLSNLKLRIKMATAKTTLATIFIEHFMYASCCFQGCSFKHYSLLLRTRSGQSCLASWIKSWEDKSWESSIVFTDMLVRLPTSPGSPSGLQRPRRHIGFMNDWKQAWRRPACSEGRDSLGAGVLWISLGPAQRLLMSQPLSTTAFQSSCPLWQGLVGEIVGGSLGLTLSIWDSLRIKDQGARVTMTS